MSLTHTVINHGGTPVQVTAKFDFAYDELTPRSAVEDAQKYADDPFRLTFDKISEIVLIFGNKLYICFKHYQQAGFAKENIIHFIVN